MATTGLAGVKNIRCLVAENPNQPGQTISGIPRQLPVLNPIPYVCDLQSAFLSVTFGFQRSWTSGFADRCIHTYIHYITLHYIAYIQTHTHIHTYIHYITLHTYIHIIHIYIYVCVSVCLSFCLSVCLFVCLSVCLSAFLPACLAAWLPCCLAACLPVCLSVCRYACMHACTYVCVHVCVCVRVCICICICTSMCMYIPYLIHQEPDLGFKAIQIAIVNI